MKILKFAMLLSLPLAAGTAAAHSAAETELDQPQAQSAIEGDAAESPAAALCANGADREIVAKRMSSGTPLSLHTSWSALGMTQAKMLNALEPDMQAGVSGKYFHTVWELMRTWKDANVAVIKLGQVLSVRGPLPPGRDSVFGSKYFNLNPNTPHLAGHLRPDLIEAIYAAKAPPSLEGQFGAVFFFDRSGEQMFSVTALADGAPKVGEIELHATPEEARKAFEELQKNGPEVPEGGYFPREFLDTFAAMRAMPQYCRQGNSDAGP